MNTKKYAPKLPLQLDKDGNFVKIDDFIQNCKQKLRMIILTNPGEKIMEPNFGVGIKRYLFESTSGIVTFNYINGTLDNVSAENIQETIKNSIISQVTRYASDIQLYNVDVSLEEQMLYVNIGYNYKGITTDNLELQITL